MGSVLHRRVVGCESLGAHRAGLSLHGGRHHTTSAPSGPGARRCQLPGAPCRGRPPRVGPRRRVAGRPEDQGVRSRSGRSPTCCRIRRLAGASATRWRSSTRCCQLRGSKIWWIPLERLGNGAAIKRLGYLLEVLGYDTAAVDRTPDLRVSAARPVAARGRLPVAPVGPADQRRRVGMITNREIANFAGEWQLAHHVVEKDYVLGWLLAGIANHPQTRSWAFKGGTCLRKCWFEDVPVL